MEPATHILTGACLARTGLNRKAAYATVAMAIAAEFPDIDTLWGLRGPVSGFEHHRGITHTLVGLPFEAAIVVALFAGIHAFRRRRIRNGRPDEAFPLTKAPVRWGRLYGLILIAFLSHLLLDYTNNYGLRPFFPFNPHWYAGSIVFIFDPLIFLVLIAGLTLPFLFGLIGQEVGSRKENFRGAGWARAALLLILGLWTFRAYEHGRALKLANDQTLRSPSQGEQDTGATTGSGQDTGVPAQEPVRPLLVAVRSWASPDPLSPFRWYTATDFGPAYVLGSANTRNGSLSSDQVLDKPAATAALERAEASHLGRVYLDWSPMPWITVSQGEAVRGGSEASDTTVLFQDTRFMGASPWLHRGGLPPLTGVVHLGPDGQVIEQGIDGRFGR